MPKQVNENIHRYKFQDASHRYDTETRTSATKILMEQEDQPSNNPYEWTTIALAVLSSANAGTALYILFLVFYSVYPLGHALLRLLKPSLAVKTLNNTVKATIVRYQERQGMLGDTTGFDVTRVYELRIEALTLKEKHIQAHQRLSLMIVSSWVGYVNDGRKIWVTARGYQREIDQLKGELKMAIFQAERTQATREHQAIPWGQDGYHASSANISEYSDSMV
ncbi:hypothetical protein ARMGADRAFT_1069338 [Armillaria gallica]|uniref:Uncharacterized protein n=1 Tax=Armillaria gallica TaxID=47427 RepID=A0A2H3C9I4_ARMGA|nr:hypothetical protein ARMGADRAFT_1069338 [Armillaria gallica]